MPNRRNLAAGSTFSAGDSHGITRCPSETLLFIFRFLTATDVCHLRQVSKRFRDLSYDIGLWRSLYVNACVPRPPGPFLWQTCDMLQDILLRSELLGRTWTSQPFKAIRTSDSFHVDRDQDRVCYSIFRLDRLWFVRAEDRSDYYQLVCYDFKTGSHNIIWKWDRLFYANVCLNVSEEGSTVFILAFGRTPDFLAKLLKCKVNSDQRILPVSASWDVPSLKGGRNVSNIFFSRASAVYLDGEIPLIFDTLSCRFYRVPVDSEPSHRMIPCFLRRMQLLWIDTPVEESFDLRLRVFSLLESESGVSSFLSDSESIHTLRLTHTLIVPQQFSCSVSPLVYPHPLGPATQTTQFKLLLRPFEPSGGFSDTATPTYQCLTVTLPGLSPSLNSVLGLLPLIAETQTLPTVNICDVPCVALHVSEDGHARGLWKAQYRSHRAPHHTYRRFSIDASGDVCRAVIGEWSTVSHFKHEEPEEVVMRIDCFRGKAYCMSQRSGVRTCEEMFVVDIE